MHIQSMMYLFLWRYFIFTLCLHWVVIHHTSSMFSSYRWDSPLPWEMGRPITLQEYRDSVSSGGKKGVQLGPYTLRRVAGQQAGGPISALFMKEIAQTSISTVAQLTKNGKSVAVDLASYEEMDSIDNVPIRALRPTADAEDQPQFGRPGGSQFLPSRPDEASLLQKKNEQRRSLVTTVDLARPDLVQGNSSTITRKVDPIAKAAKLDGRGEKLKSGAIDDYDDDYEVERHSIQTLQPRLGSKQHSSSHPVRDISTDPRLSSASASDQSQVHTQPQQRKVLQKITSLFNF